MVLSQHRPAALALATIASIALLSTACRNGGSVSNASPRISAVPAQSTTGGSTFTLDLGAYVTDSGGANTLTYSVVSGGGSFTGDDYSHTFDAMGEYTVNFSVSDGAKTSTGSFTVKVTSSNFVVVREDNDGLLLLDSATNGQVRVLSSTNAPTFAAGLADGRMVYTVNSTQLWLFDPMSRTRTRIAENASNVTYLAKTSDSRVVYSTGSSPDVTLFYYNPTNDFSREIDDGGLSTTDVLVNGSDLVFYETGESNQSDIYYYDPTEDDSFAVGTAATDEQLLAVLPNGGVVFSRVGAGGETDLFYFKVGTGTVEIGANVSALATLNKAYNAFGTGSQVVFTATNGSNRELYVWDPADGQADAIATGTDNVFDAMGDGNEVVYHRVVSGTDHDVYFYDVATSANTQVVDTADVLTVVAVSGSSPAWVFVQGSSTTSQLDAYSLVSSPATASWSPGGTVSTTVGVVDNGDIVAQRTDNTAINHFDVSAGAWQTQVVGTGLAFQGAGVDTGDWVSTAGTGASQNLAMWDDSASSIVVVTTATGADTYQAATANGTILFTRPVGTNTNADLFVWNTTTETQLTDEDTAGIKHDYTVLGKYAGSR